VAEGTHLRTRGPLPVPPHAVPQTRADSTRAANLDLLIRGTTPASLPGLPFERTPIPDPVVPSGSSALEDRRTEVEQERDPVEDDDASDDDTLAVAQAAGNKNPQKNRPVQEHPVHSSRPFGEMAQP